MRSDKEIEKQFICAITILAKKSAFRTTNALDSPSDDLYIDHNAFSYKLEGRTIMGAMIFKFKENLYQVSNNERLEVGDLI